LPHQKGSAGGGDDGLQGGHTGISVYNNRIIGYNVDHYPRRQHQDGWQPLLGSYFKCYNNYFQDIGNYALFGDGFYGTFDHFIVFNNVAVLTDPVIQAATPQGLNIGTDGGYYNQNHRTWAKLSGLSICCNVVVDYRPTNIAGRLANGFNYSVAMAAKDTYTNCSCYNNIVVNSGVFLLEHSQYGMVANGSNISLTDAAARAHFVSFSSNTATPGNNYHLRPGSSLRNRGVNLSFLVASLGITGPSFMMDLDGNSRPTTGSWDVGPYQFSDAAEHPAAVSKANW
jgi:hypothetical protein